MTLRARRIRFTFVLVLALAVVGPRPSLGEEEEEVSFKNVKLLTKVKSKKEMRAIMKEQSKALGVKCTHCHVQGKFEVDSKPAKRKAREMMRLVTNLNAKDFKTVKPGISCWTCHRGEAEPELTRPSTGNDED